MPSRPVACMDCGRMCRGTRCVDCDRAARVITRAQAIAAIRAAAHDGVPPTLRKSGIGERTIKRLFGSWAAAVEEAGYPRPRQGVTRNAGKRKQGDTSILGPGERGDYGITVTLREQNTGAIKVAHYPGKPGDAASELIADLDADPGRWRLLSYSTPNTIYADLTRKVGAAIKAGRPEVGALQRFGRLDLLDPSVYRGDQREDKGVGRGHAWRTTHRIRLGPGRAS